MKKDPGKICNILPRFARECCEMIFKSAAENQLRLWRSNQSRFRSYSQLKKHQKKIRRVAVGFALSLAFLLVGLLAGPIIFPPAVKSEVYIPNGKGDILIGNVSRNRATIVFKTFDAANGNKPLATKAFVEAYTDEGYLKLARRTEPDDYAVTHTIAVDSLEEGRMYYVRIIASDSSTPAHTKVVTSWGDSNDPIRFYATGEIVPSCVGVGSLENTATNNETSVVDDNGEDGALKAGGIIEAVDNIGYQELPGKASLQIIEVQNENYLQPKNKVQTIISWKTNIPAKAVLIYKEGNGGEELEVASDGEMQMKHGVVLTTLKAGKAYYFKVKSQDESGNVVISEEYSLRTPQPKETVVQQIKDNLKSILDNIKPN